MDRDRAIAAALEAGARRGFGKEGGRGRVEALVRLLQTAPSASSPPLPLPLQSAAAAAAAERAALYLRAHDVRDSAMLVRYFSTAHDYYLDYLAGCESEEQERFLHHLPSVAASESPVARKADPRPASSPGTATLTPPSTAISPSLPGALDAGGTKEAQILRQSRSPPPMDGAKVGGHGAGPAESPAALAEPVPGPALSTGQDLSVPKVAPTATVVQAAVSASPRSPLPLVRPSSFSPAAGRRSTPVNVRVAAASSDSVPTPTAASSSSILPWITLAHGPEHPENRSRRGLAERECAAGGQGQGEDAAEDAGTGAAGGAAPAPRPLPDLPSLPAQVPVPTLSVSASGKESRSSWTVGDERFGGHTYAETGILDDAVELEDSLWWEQRYLLPMSEREPSDTEIDEEDEEGVP